MPGSTPSLSDVALFEVQGAQDMVPSADQYAENSVAKLFDDCQSEQPPEELAVLARNA